MERNPEGAQFVHPARVRHLRRIRQDPRKVALRFANILVLLIQPMQQIRIQRPHLGIEDLFFFPEVKFGQYLEFGYSSLYLENPFGSEIEERGEELVQVFLNRPMIGA